MTRLPTTLTFWLSVAVTLAAVVALVARIVRIPGAPYPVTASVVAAILILVSVGLALKEYFEDDCARYERRVHSDLAKNLEER